MVKALHRKLLRDLVALRGQVLTIALVVACGIASDVTITGAYRSLLTARDVYYAEYGFPDAFCGLKRAPNALRERLLAVPGVARVRTRLREAITLPMSGELTAASGTLLSAPPPGQGVLGGVRVAQGRLPAADHEALVLQSFVEAHGLELGDPVPILVDGVRRKLTIVGTGASPEMLFAVAPGEMIPDPKRYAVVWMEHGAVARLLRMQGAFNEVVFALQSAANRPEVLDRVERLLQPYGGAEPYLRDRQISHRLLLGELSQLKNMAAFMPVVFLGVAAFLISMVLGRMVQLQRPQIAALKAVGYSDSAVGLHFLQMMWVIVTLGAMLGIGAGAYLGRQMMFLYARYFQFPDLSFQLTADLLFGALLVSVLAATLGALQAVRAVVRLPPAEAMRPEPPARYRATMVDRLGLSAHLSQTSRMILREVERHPLRSLLSALALAFAVALLVLGRFSFDAIGSYIELTFSVAQRQDMTATFIAPQPEAALRELRALPGVLRVEGERRVPVTLQVEARSRELSLLGSEADALLTRITDAAGRVQSPPTAGLLLSEKLAELLHVRPGQEVRVQVQQGERQVLRLPVRGTINDMMGLNAHMELAALHRLLGEERSYSAAHLRVDPRYRERILRELAERPRVYSVAELRRMLQRFQEQTASQMRSTTWIMTLFALAIAAGVVYNNARLALSMRGRDLASLRVLGFYRAEIAILLLGELALQVLIALPPGLWLGTMLAQLMMDASDPEQYRLPLVISLRTYFFAVAATLLASALSAWTVRRKLDHLDLTAVLKTRG